MLMKLEDHPSCRGQELNEQRICALESCGERNGNPKVAVGEVILRVLLT